MTPRRGPWLTTAVFCREGDDQLAVIDGLDTIRGSDLRIALMLGLVRDDHVGSIDLRLTAHSPSNDQVGEVVAIVDLPDAGDVPGQVMVPITVGQVQDGTYWFELRLQDRLITRLPLRVTNPPE